MAPATFVQRGAVLFGIDCAVSDDKPLRSGRSPRLPSAMRQVEVDRAP
jgi:hypothetical protein